LTGGGVKSVAGPSSRCPSFITMSDKPPVVPGEHVIIITQVNPYTPVGGVTVVLQNLLSSFDQDSYTFAYLGRFDWRWKDRKKYRDCYRLIPNFHPLQFLDRVFRGIKQRYAIKRAVKLAKRKNARIVFGLYPTLNSLHVATEVAKQTGAAYFPYLHDTVAEGLSHSNRATFAKRVQDEVFRTAKLVVTMSDGMTDYYREKYGMETEPLVHSYPERLADKPNYERTKNAFWGGEVYHINDRGFARVQKALLAKDTQIIVTSLSPLKIEDDKNVTQTFYPSRQDYIDAVKQQGILVLTINWPDESDVHEAELSTIFPTKTVEYLATGSPILAHCPDHYFLAKFVRQHKCGVVVSERSEEALGKAIEFLQSGSDEVRQLQDNALKTIEMFSIKNVAATFSRQMASGVAD
jgi:glycosyltransferase involved in cell wall biosynthesis